MTTYDLLTDWSKCLHVTHTHTTVTVYHFIE